MIVVAAGQYHARGTGVIGTGGEVAESPAILNASTTDVERALQAIVASDHVPCEEVSGDVAVR